MKPAEFRQELDAIVVGDLDKSVKQYRHRGLLHLCLGIFVWMFSSAVALISVLLAFSPLLPESDSVIGWIFILLGIFMLINGLFDLARNFCFSAMLEYRRANLLAADQNASTPDVVSVDQ